MPFEPLTPEEQALYPETCRHPEHDPPAHIVIRRSMKWVCPACGAAVIIQPPVLRFMACSETLTGRRTRSEVREARSTVRGCCNRHADNMGFSCLKDAEPACSQCRDTGYAVHPQNGWVKGRRCPRGCAVDCHICRDPNCDNPDGQH